MTDHAVTLYAKQVTSGDITAGHMVRLAAARHLRDLDTLPALGYRFDEDDADHAIGFFPRFLRLAEGEHAGQPFDLQPWQQFIIGSLFGWKGPDGFRRFRTAYIEIAKGNGKTPMLAGIGLYGITCDGEEGAQVFAAAVTREQAKILFDDARHLASQSPDLLAELIIGENNIAHTASKSFLRPVSAEGRSLDAKRVHMALIDEIHEHLTAAVVNKLRAGVKGRRQPLVAEITNSGYDQLSICWQHHEMTRKILEQVISDEAWFGFVATLDPCEACRLEGHQQPKDGCRECDDYRDPDLFLKTNPNLGVSIHEKYLLAQIHDAEHMPANRDLILRLNFCLWTSRHRVWIPADRWRTCGATVPDDDLVGVPCFAGLDLGQTDDFSALALLFLLPDGRFATRMRYWIPEAAKQSKPDRPYGLWERENLLVLTDGDATDYDLVEREVVERCQRWGVQELAYDKRFAESMAQHLTGLGIACVDMPQGYQLNEGISKIENLVAKSLLCHGDDPVLAWMVSNVVLRRGQRGERRLDKDKAADKIDGVAAVAMAMARAIVAPSGSSVYDQRGVLFL